MRRKLRVGLVGCGKVSLNHVLAYGNMNTADIVAVFDVHAPSAEAMSKKLNVPVAESLKSMAADFDLDAVNVCTPPATHLECCKPFLKAGIGVYCEKPLEVDVPAAKRLASAAKRSGTPFMIGFGHRFVPGVIELKKLLDKGVLGEPLLFRNIFGGYAPLEGNHRCNPALSGGGPLIDHCSHSVDLFRYLVGDPTQVQAFTGNILQKVAVEDFGMMQLNVGGKSFGNIIGSYSLKNGGSWVEWIGTKGAATVSYWNEGHPDLAYRVDGGSWKAVDCSKHVESRYEGAIRYFIKCLRTGKQPEVTAYDGLMANKIVAAAYESAATARTVRMR